MAKKIRPGSQGDVLGREAASLRRGAPGKRFVGERAAQSRQAKRQELARVTVMAEAAEEVRRREELREQSVAQVLLGLAIESYRLAKTFALAPFRIMDAMRRTRVEGRA
jgi:hypothetical protein